VADVIEWALEPAAQATGTAEDQELVAA
jgi:hypothetical protein